MIEPLRSLTVTNRVFDRMKKVPDPPTTSAFQRPTNKSVAKSTREKLPTMTEQSFRHSNATSVQHTANAALIIPRQTTRTETREGAESLLNSFRRVNRVVRCNKSSELQYRATHEPRFGFQIAQNTLPSTFAGRAPKLSNKIAGMAMCETIIAQKESEQKISRAYAAAQAAQSLSIDSNQSARFKLDTTPLMTTRREIPNQRYGWSHKAELADELSTPPALSTLSPLPQKPLDTSMFLKHSGPILKISHTLLRDSNKQFLKPSLFSPIISR